MINMEIRTTFGMVSVTVGLVLFFTSGSIQILSSSLGTVFRVLGIVLFYSGLALVLWIFMTSLNNFLYRMITKIRTRP
jgi:hypothetical protein